MGELRIIGRKSIVMVGETVEGDLKLTWRKDNARDVSLAEETFNEYITRGWLAIGEVSGKQTQIFTFNPNFDTIVLAPIVVGG